MDKITLQRIESLHPDLRTEAKAMYAEMWDRCTGNAKPRFTYTLRTFAEQDAIYAQGRTKPGKIVTKAKGGQSFHNYGLAFDLCLIIDRDGNGTYEEVSWSVELDFDNDKTGDFLECVYVAKMYGYEWGGEWLTFKDRPHFQKTFGYTTPQLLAKYNAKEFEGETEYVQI